MSLICHTISEKQLKLCSYEDAIKNIKQQTSSVWIDLIDAEQSILEQILDDLDVHGMLRSFCIEETDHPGFYPLRPVSFLVLPVQMEMQKSNTIKYFSVLFSEHYVVTIRDKAMARMRKNATAEESIQFLPDSTPIGLLSSFLLGLSLDCIRKAAKLGDIISEMENQVDKDPLSFNLEQISDYRAEVMALESIVQGQLPVLEVTAFSNGPAILGEAARNYLIWASANFKTAEKKLQWMEHRIELLRSTMDMHSQETMNKRLGRLTVLSMIFMPITFLAGVWGMNFENMPFLKHNLGYAFAILSMLIIASVMYLYFKKRGWFN